MRNRVKSVGSACGLLFCFRVERAALMVKGSCGRVEHRVAFKRFLMALP